MIHLDVLLLGNSSALSRPRPRMRLHFVERLACRRYHLATWLSRPASCMTGPERADCCRSDLYEFFVTIRRGVELLASCHFPLHRFLTAGMPISLGHAGYCLNL